MVTSNIANHTKLSQSAFLLNLKKLLLVVIWSISLSVVGNSGVATLEGSKSIKICQCNENLAVVDECLLFRGAIIEEFHCTYVPLFYMGQTNNSNKVALQLGPYIYDHTETY